MSNAPVVFETILNAPVEQVWKALTDTMEMKHWYFDIALFKPEVGFEFQFAGGSEKKTYIHHCRITDVTVNKKLSYTWRYEEIEGISEVTFRLSDEDGHTRIILTHEGIDHFQTSNPDFARESFEAGWTYIIGTSLKDFVEKNN